MRTRIDLVFTAAILTTSILLLVNILKNGIYSSHDGEIHTARIVQFREAAQDQIPVRWLPNLNFGFGYPTYVYLYSLPYYLATLISSFASNPEVIFKVLMFLSISLSAVSFYFVVRILGLGPVSAFIGSLFYIAAPYRFADIYERGALGESLAFIFLPLLFIAPKIIKENLLSGAVFTTTVIFALLTTHSITFAIFAVPALMFSLLIFGQVAKRYFPIFLTFIFCGSVLSSFQTLPVIFEQKYIELDKTYFNIFQGTFISLNQLLRIPKEGVNIGTGIQLGLAGSSIILLSLVVVSFEFLAKKSLDKFTIFFLITSLVAAFLTLDISKSVWLAFKPLTTVLFPWRFLTFTTFAAAVLASLFANRFVKSNYSFVIILILIFIALYPSRHYWQGQGWHTNSADYYANYQDPYKLDNYYLPKGLAANLQELQLEPVSTVDGDGVVSLLKKQSNLIRAQTASSRESKIQFHTMYFPGWTLTIDNEKSEIIRDYPNLQGLIVAKVPKGSHLVTLEFRETPLRRAANFISLFAFMILAAIVLARIYLAQSSRKVKQVL